MPATAARPGTASGMMGIGPAMDPGIVPKSLGAFVAIGGDRVFYAASKLRRRQYAECVAICSELLEKNPYDQSVWYLKCQALTAQAWVDDTEMEEEGVAEVLMDQNAMAEAPRPGTSLARPLGTASGKGPNMSVRPMTGSGRESGF
jgi:tetratricopeptide repeat protein 8